MKAALNQQNYYEVLGVTQKATSVDIKKAYFTKIREFPNENHPIKFQELTNAYKILMNNDSKMRYDRNLANNGSYEKNLSKAENLMEKNQYSSALPLLTNILLDNPFDIVTLQDIAVCHINLDNLEEAKRILLKLDSESPNDLLTLHLLGQTYIELKEFHLATTCYEKLISLSPREANYYIHLSNIHCELNQFDKAIKTIERKFKLEKEKLHDYPLLIELYFITMVANHKSHHDEIVDRITNLPSNEDEEVQLLSMLIGTIENLEPENNGYKGLVNLAEEINNYTNDEINEWLEEAESAIRQDMYYYGETIPEYTKIQNSSSARVEENRGSVFWSIVFGIISSFFLTPIGGIIVGFLWYFMADSIKAILSVLGCLGTIIIIFIIFFIL